MKTHSKKRLFLGMASVGCEIGNTFAYHSNCMLLYLRIVLFLLPTFSFCQNFLSGNVVEKESGTVIENANVFFSQTTMGTTTDERGYFSFKGVPKGKYELVISHVGFAPFHLMVEMEDQSKEVLEIELVQQVVELPSLTIQADTTDWHQNFLLFKYFFLGNTENARQCTIKNPKDIFLYFDVEEGILYGHATKPILVENLALGYQLTFLLENFKADRKNKKILIAGRPFFEELLPNNPKMLKVWKENRKKAYYGSFTHFIQNLYSGELSLDEFEIFELVPVVNSKKFDPIFLEEKLNYWKGREKESITRNQKKQCGDSLRYYEILKSNPDFEKGKSKRVVDVRALIVEDQLNYDGYLKVIFKGEKPEKAFLKLIQEKSKYQVSIVHFNKGLKIYENGYVDDVHKVFLEGYLAWSGKIAELVPLEYFPN